jgi:4-hydroxy-3-polyprenylbenzoate decarboxylase
MPDAGTAHNLVIVKINKSYPGQGMKVISSLFGAGQMMFSKYIIVVSGQTDIRNYPELMLHVVANVDPGKDILFIRGPLDVLDHSADSFSFGGKAGIDATIKHIEENYGRTIRANDEISWNLPETQIITNLNVQFLKQGIPLLIISLNPSADEAVIEKAKSYFIKNDPGGSIRFILVVDHTVDINDLFMVSWQMLGNSDPVRDHEYLNNSALFIDGTIKAFRKGGFPRNWPNIVRSSEETISGIDKKWDSLGIGRFINSPSLKYEALNRKGKDEIIT